MSLLLSSTWIVWLFFVSVFIGSKGVALPAYLVIKFTASGYCVVRTWSPSSALLPVIIRIYKSSGNYPPESLFFFWPSWCSSSRQRMGWIIFWRLVPGRRETTGQLTSLLWLTSCRQLEVVRSQTRKTLLAPSYTTSIWGKPAWLLLSLCRQQLSDSTSDSF